MPNFDYAIFVGVCTLTMLIGLRVAIPLMRASTRRRTDEMLLRIGSEEANGNKNAAARVAPKEENEPKKSRPDR